METKEKSELINLLKELLTSPEFIRTIAENSTISVANLSKVIPVAKKISMEDYAAECLVKYGKDATFSHPAIRAGFTELYNAQGKQPSEEFLTKRISIYLTLRQVVRRANLMLETIKAQAAAAAAAAEADSKQTTKVIETPKQAAIRHGAAAAAARQNKLK